MDNPWPAIALKDKLKESEKDAQAMAEWILSQEAPDAIRKIAKKCIEEAF